METTIRTIELRTGEHRYIFRYSLGHESELREALAAFASDDNYNFDWLDAAALSYCSERTLARELEKKRVINYRQFC